MGFRFRKSIKLAPGVRLNLTKKGVSSLSIGKRGTVVNIGKKGTRATVSLTGSGLSYSAYKSHANAQKTAKKQTQYPSPQPINEGNVGARPVSIILGIGIFLLPLIFAWFTLRQGYSTVSRVISMVWMVIFIFMMR